MSTGRKWNAMISNFQTPFSISMVLLMSIEELDIGFNRRISSRKATERNFADIIIIPQVYQKQLPISVAKKALWQKYYSVDTYKNLPYLSSVLETTAEPVENDSELEGEEN